MHKKQIALASLSHLCCDVNTGSLPAILPYLIAEHGLSYSATSALMLANSSLSSFIQPLFGLLADRNPQTYFMPLGILIAGLAMASVGFVENYWAIFCAVGLSGIGAALFHPAAMRFTNSVAGAKQGTGTSIFSIGGNIGFLIGPLLAVALIEWCDLRGLGLLAPLALIMALLIFYEIKHLPPKPKAPFGKSVQETHLKNDWKAFNLMVIAVIFRSIIMICFRVFFPLYLIANFSQSKSAAAVALTIFGLSGIIGNILGGLLADRYGYSIIVKITYLLLIPCLVVFPFLENLVLIYIDLIIIAFMVYASYSPIVVLGQKYLPNHVGFSAGITLGLSISIGGLFSPVLGLVADTYGLLYVFYALSIFASLGFLFTLLLPKPNYQAYEVAL
ncbi:MAG: MFS transporter [Desulfovibrionaceae bacterium]|nr:MFS transporter [Desulfovibrionaceae bacterium]